jgi:hypothetical protein
MVLAGQMVCAQRGARHPERCPTCGQLLVCTEVLPRAGAPPPVRWRERAPELGTAGETCQGCVCGRPWDGGRWPAAASRGSQEAHLPRRAPRYRAERGGARPAGRGGAPRQLHSVRLARPGQAASVRGQSNKELQRSPGRWGCGGRLAGVSGDAT